MTAGTLITILALGTLAAIAGFALWSRSRTKALSEDPDNRKSTLAADAPDGYDKS